MKTRTILLALSLFVTASSAFAQPTKPGPTTAPAPPPPPEPPPPPPPGPPPLSETLTGEAKQDYESAKILFNDGDAAGALVKFKSAYSKSQDSRLLWNMAACEKNLRHYSSALRLVRQYVADSGDKLTDADKKEADDLVKVMEPLTAKLKLDVNEPGAEVFVDDELVGTTPVPPVVVDIGTRKIRVRKGEFEEYVKDVPIGGAAEVPLSVNLVKILHQGHLNVRVRQNDATIDIDGKVVGAGSWAGILPSGGHTLRVTAPKMKPYQSEVYIQDKENREVAVTLEPEPSKGLPLWAYIAGGVVIAGGLTAAGAFIFGGEDTYEGPQGNLNPGIVQANRPIVFW